MSTEASLTIVAASCEIAASCPHCHQVSPRVHSYYQRHPQDLPISGQTVHLILRVRRFRCGHTACHAQTFVERLPEVVPSHAQRTTRLLGTLRQFALALSGQAGSRLLKRIGMSASADTLLRLAKEAKLEPIITPTHLGVDDFAIRRGMTYGTILVNLSTHQPVDLLKDRTADVLAQWLRAHPGVEYITRDRSAEYAQGASEGAPQAQQIVDRWHLLKNWREALERALGRVHARLQQRQAASGVIIGPRYKKSRSSSEVAASHMARLRRQARYQEVIERYQQGKGVEKIAKELHMSPT